MASLCHLVVATVVLFLVATCSSAYEDPAGTYCNPNSGIVPGGPVSDNIGLFVAGSALAAQAGARFISSTYGEEENVVYGLAQCRGELNETDCFDCIQAAGDQIQKSCPNLSDAQIWYNYCTLRYSQHRFFGKFDTSNGVVLVRNQRNYPDPQALSDALTDLFDGLNNVAVDPNGGGFAAGQTKLSDSDTLYGMAQCTKDLSSFACAECLNAAMSEVEDYCGPSRGCRVFYSTCAVRYELYPFIPHEIPNQAVEKLIIRHEFPKAKQIHKLRSRKSMMISSF